MLLLEPICPWLGEKAHVSETQPRPLPHPGHLELPAGAESHALSHPAHLPQLGPGPFIWSPPSFLAPKIPVCGPSETRSLPYALPGRGSRPYCSGQGTGRILTRAPLPPGWQWSRAVSVKSSLWRYVLGSRREDTHYTYHTRTRADTHTHTHTHTHGGGDSEVGN